MNLFEDSFDIYQKQEDLSKTHNPGVWDAEFAAELGDRLLDKTNSQLNNTYAANGPKAQNAADRVIVTYNGTLAKNGAKEIYATVGYGNNTGWAHPANYQMHTGTNGGFEVMIPTRGSQSINLTFQDNTGRTDNNNGSNYILNGTSGNASIH